MHRAPPKHCYRRETNLKRDPREQGKETYVTAIRKLVHSISKSQKHHAIIISGPPGYGKTTAVDCAIRDSGVKAVHLGAYSSPLGFFNFLAENSDSFIIIDDTSGLFSENSAMAILKAATWDQNGQRILRWRTPTALAVTSEFCFSGKFVIICNSFPNTADGSAVKSRSFLRPIEISSAEAKQLLLTAATDPSWYEDTDVAIEVAEFLCERVTEDTVSKISYRTLEKGYALAKDHPESWQDLLSPEIPAATTNPKRLIRDLAKQNIKVKEQIHIFERTTGLKRRSFFKYRSQANLAGTGE